MNQKLVDPGLGKQQQVAMVNQNLADRIVSLRQATEEHETEVESFRKEVELLKAENCRLVEKLCSQQDFWQNRAI